MLLHPIDSKEKRRYKTFLRGSVFLLLFLGAFIFFSNGGTDYIKKSFLANPIYNSIIIFGLLFVLFIERVFLRRTKFIGEWSSYDGGLLKFKKNGTFSATNLPKRLFTSDTSNINDTINISGKWGVAGSNFTTASARIMTPKERMVLKYKYPLVENKKDKVTRYTLEMRMPFSVYSSKPQARLLIDSYCFNKINS